MKEFIGILFVSIIGFAILYLILDSDHIRQQQYRSCNITSTDKALCEDILK